MTKGELIEAIAHYRDLNLKRAESVVNTIFDSMSNAVDGDRVEVRGSALSKRRIRCATQPQDGRRGRS